MSIPANSTRNSPAANTERYVVRARRWFAAGLRLVWWRS